MAPARPGARGKLARRSSHTWPCLSLDQDPVSWSHLGSQQARKRGVTEKMTGQKRKRDRKKKKKEEGKGNNGGRDQKRKTMGKE